MRCPRGHDPHHGSRWMPGGSHCCSVSTHVHCIACTYRLHSTTYSCMNATLCESVIFLYLHACISSPHALRVMTHETSWMMDPSISLVTCLVPLQRCSANISWCVVHPLRCKGYGPYRQALPARESLIERVTPSFFSRSYTSLMPSRAVRLGRQLMTMGSDLMTRASRVPTHGPSARWLTSVRGVY